MDKSALLERFRVIFSSSNMNARLKFFFEDGSNVLVDCTGTQPQFLENTQDPGDADFRANFDHAMAIFTGKLDPMRAILTRKLKAGGDMGLALKLAKLLGSQKS